MICFDKIRCEHWTDELRNIYAANFANGILRKTFGLKRLSRTTTGPAFAAKLALAGVVKAAGLQNKREKPFTIDFAELTYEQFIREILIEKLGLHTLVIGHDHRLGKNREGTFDNVGALSQKLHFGVEKIETFLINNVDILSFIHN